MRIRFAVYVKYISYFEVRVFVRDVDGSFVYRPKSLPAEGKWTVIEMRADEFKHERIRGLAIAPGDTIKIVSIAAGKPPLKTKLFIDDFQITVKR